MLYRRNKKGGTTSIFIVFQDEGEIILLLSCSYFISHHLETDVSKAGHRTSGLVNGTKQITLHHSLKLEPALVKIRK